MSPLRRVSFFFRRRARRDRELNEEIRSHFKMAVEDRIARGQSRKDAERAVRREFGNPDHVKEITRAMWPGAWLDRLRQDLRFGLRSLWRDPAFTWATIVVLTIGIGAGTTVFTLANGALYENAPGIADPHELVGVRWIESGVQGRDRESSWGYADYAYVRAEMDAFDGVLGYLSEPIPVATSEETGFQADAWIVTDNFFDVLGAQMALGRGFTPDEGQTPGTHPVVVISDAFWQTRFGADPTVLGSAMSLNGTPFTIVGVTPPGFRGISPIERPPDVYVPVMMQGVIIPGSDTWFERVDGESSGWLRLVARLRDGTTIGGAQAGLDSVRAGWNDAFGAWWASLRRPEFRMLITPEYKHNLENEQRLQRMLGYLAAIAGAILVIGAANVAILLLARGTARRDEMGVRVALGAGRARLFAQLLVENLIVGVIGGVGGLTVAYLAVRSVVPLLPYRFSSSLAPDVTVLAFTGAVALVATLSFGVLPSARISRAGPGSALRSTARVTRAGRFRNTLVVGQMAGAAVLVVGAGLFVRSIVAAQSIDPGFDPDGRLTISTALSEDYDDERGLGFVNDALDRARALPGVRRATVAARAPFSGGRTDEGVRIPDTPFADSTSILNFNWVGPDYFETIGIPIVAGRAIDARDDDGGPRALIVNETTARRFWPDQSAIGKTISRQNRLWTIVGVAADANYYALGEEPVSQVYVPIAQDFIPYPTFILDADVPPESLARAAESLIRDLDPGVTIYGTQTLQDFVDAQAASYRLLAVVGTAFGLVALTLAVAGLYGVQSYFVSQRFREIGIRIALGAQSQQVSAGILTSGAILGAMGVALGLSVAFLAGGAIDEMLFGVRPGDLPTYSGVAAMFLLTSLAASYVPARRASRVEPIVVLREE